jgi:uncharacterized caspase-like protein
VRRLTTRRLFASAVFAALAIFFSYAAEADDHPLRGVALVIGQSDYSGLPKLSNPQNDARAIDGLLDGLGFDVTRVLDGTGDKLRQKIARFLEDAADADVAVVYYSGHGIEAGGEDYLVPVDADLSTPQRAGETLLPVSELLGQLAKTVPVTIVLLDACRTGAFPDGTMIQPPGASVPVVAQTTGLGVIRGPAPVAKAGAPAAGYGMVIGFAASPGQPALDGAGGDENSPYAAAILKHFGAGGYSFGDVMTLVSEEVYLKTGARQLPWVNSSLRRVLSFAQPPAADPDQSAIRSARRQLLLNIATTPPETQKYVESLAGEEKVPLDELYGMLGVLGVDTSDPSKLQQQLRQGAAQLKQLMAEKPGGVKQDAELQRLSDLADNAQREGAIALALDFRAKASLRAEALARQRDASEEALKADRVELGETFAAHAQTAVLNFDYATAANKYAEAYAQVDRWDDVLAISYIGKEALALTRLGAAGGDPAALTRALTLYPKALARAPRGDFPEQWGAIQSDYAVALSIAGERSSDTSVLRQAIAAFEAALEVRTRQADAADWSVTKSGLGNALWLLGNRTADNAMRQAALKAFLDALDAVDRTADPYRWGMIETNIGNALAVLANVPGNATRLDDSVAALRAAADALRSAHASVDWANTATNLASVLVAKFDADADRAKLTEAIGIFGDVLKVRTQAAMPLDWGVTMVNLGTAQKSLGAADNSAEELETAAATFRAALTALQRDTVPFDWALAQANLGEALLDLGTLGEQDQLEPAIAAFRAALEVRTRAAAPEGWARTTNDLGWALGMHGADIGDKAMVAEGRAAIVAAEELYATWGDYSAYFADRLKIIDAALATMP